MTESRPKSAVQSSAKGPLLAAIAAVVAMAVLWVAGPILWPLESAWISRHANAVGYDFRGAAPIPVLAWLAAAGLLALAALVGAARTRSSAAVTAALAIIALVVGVVFHQATLRRAIGILASDFHMRDIAVSMKAYDDTARGVPLAYSTDAGGRPLLSWRVHLLPYLEHQSLYQEFHLDEPWDSPHNRPLLEKMPAVYRSGGGDPGPGRTRILAVRGPRTFLKQPSAGQFGQKPPRGYRWDQATTDGASSIVLLVEVPAERAIEWTKPDDFDLAAPGAYAQLFEGVPWVRASFVDGRVTLLERRYVTEAEFQSASDHGDGATVNLDD